MNVRVEYGDNYLEFNNIVISREEEKNGNPYNTSFGVRVKSGAFQGEGQFECDVKELIQFISELKQLYQFEISEVEFQEIGYGCTIKLEMDHCGHITVTGDIFDKGMSQELKYEFEADQTVLLPFINSLDSYVKGIKLRSKEKKMKLFDRLKRRQKNDEAFKEKIQTNLDILAEMDIRANDEDFIEWLLKKWRRDRDESDLFTRLLYSLGGEREDNGIWTPLSDDVYMFDTECICDGSDYEFIIKRLSEITKGEFLIHNVKTTVDHDNCTVSLSFEYNSVIYDWNPLYQGDWFDCNIIFKLNSILQEQGSKKFFYNSSTDQNMNIIFSSEDTIRELNKIVSIPFKLI